MILSDIRRRPVAAIATLLLISLGIALGIWQLQRAAYKEQLASKLEQAASANPLLVNDSVFKPEDALNQRILAKGVFLKNQGVWLENRPHPLGRDPKTGIATGFYLLMPLQLANDSKKILWVNRGWVPRHFERMNQVPNVITPEELVTVQGIALDSPSKTYELGKESGLLASDGLPIEENLSLTEPKRLNGQEQLPIVLRQDDSQLNDGLQRQWPKPDSGVQKHYGYAFQWFALALMSFIFWLVTGYRAQAKSLR